MELERYKKPKRLKQCAFRLVQFYTDTTANRYIQYK